MGFCIPHELCMPHAMPKIRSLRPRSESAEPRNIFSKLVTLATFHVLRSWENAEAPLNIERIVRTREVLRWERGWLKADAPWNMPDRSVAAEVSKSKGELNDDAPLNMSRMLVAAAVSRHPSLSTSPQPCGALLTE